MKGGLGSLSLDMGEGIVLGALVVVNAIGGVFEPDTGSILAGPRGPEGRPLDSTNVYLDPLFGRDDNTAPPAELGNTTIGVVATNVQLNKAQTNRLATIAHDGLALAIRPTHTPHDGDTMFALATGEVEASEEFVRLCALTPTVVARAIVNGVKSASSARGIPAASEISG